MGVANRVVEAVNRVPGDPRGGVVLVRGVEIVGRELAVASVLLQAGLRALLEQEPRVGHLVEDALRLGRDPRVAGRRGAAHYRERRQCGEQDPGSDATHAWDIQDRGDAHKSPSPRARRLTGRVWGPGKPPGLELRSTCIFLSST